MTRLFTFLALMISTLIVEGLRGLLQATPRPSGVYGGTVPDATGEIIFNAGHPTFSMDVVILGCPLAVQGLQYQVVHLKEEAYNVKVDHTGTNLVQQVNACGDLRIVIGDFAEMTFYFNPSDNENAIELRSTTEEWEGRFEHT
ncbi:hypothetical protein FOL47_011369 [Perkinsus chesapeaki]|uniref:Uncharacterized protein n=1 Tax=Perkinsus chesapeaki TaxID=330153 RepID=A0A7J6MNG8_PERCH|nr:hypothetical protein FOL47_011369 [Perkinsus chesapeaki]